MNFAFINRKNADFKSQIKKIVKKKYLFHRSINNTIRIEECTDYKEHTEKVTLKEGETYLLLPGQVKK
jgi:hypothetical protein